MSHASPPPKCERHKLRKPFLYHQLPNYNIRITTLYVSSKTLYSQAQIKWNLSPPRSTSSSSTAPRRPTRSPCSCPEGWWSLSCIRFWMGSITFMPTGCSTGIWWAAILASVLQFPFTHTHTTLSTHFIMEPFPKATPLTSQKHCYRGGVPVFF